MRIAVFCSGSGTNLEAIIDSCKKGHIKGELALVVSDVADCFALKRAKKAGIQTFVLDKKNFSSREESDRAILKKLKAEKIALVVLAGYMRLLSRDFIKEYENRIMNIHPALLPSFKGTHGIKDAFEYGVKVTGPTVHFVTEDMDTGPVILQSAVSVTEDDTEDSLAEAIHKEEHKIYPRAIQLFVEGRLKIEGKRVRIL